MAVEIVLGKIESISETDPYQVMITAKPLIDRPILAYPIRYNDEPEVGDEVIVFILDPLTRLSCLYEIIRTDDFTGIKFQGTELRFTKDNINIKAKTINISDGEVNIRCPNDMNIVGDVHLNGSLNATNDISSMNCPSLNEFYIWFTRHTHNVSDMHDGGPTIHPTEKPNN